LGCHPVAVHIYTQLGCHPVAVHIYTQLGCHPVAVHIYTQTIHRTKQIITNVEQCVPCPVFASFTLAFALQLRKKHGKTLSQGKKTLSQVKKNLSHSTVYILPKHPHITKPTQTHTLQHPHTHTHTHTHTYIYIYITKRYKNTTVQIKTNTVQDIPK
jgi:hypothetical protein